MMLLLLQVTLVPLTSLVCGWLARKLGQSREVGEIVGGIPLGGVCPSNASYRD